MGVVDDFKAMKKETGADDSACAILVLAQRLEKEFQQTLWDEFSMMARVLANENVDWPANRERVDDIIQEVASSLDIITGELSDINVSISQLGDKK